MALDEGTYGIVSQLGKAVAAEVEQEEVGRSVQAKVNAICDRAYRREDRLDAVDALGYHVRLVLDNDEGTFNEVRKRTRRHVEAADPCPVCQGTNTAGPGLVGENTECCYCGPSGTVRRHPAQLGEDLKELVEVLSGLEGVENASRDGIVRGAEGGANALDSMTVEILSTALAWVDWEAVALVYLSEADDDRNLVSVAASDGASSLGERIEAAEERGEEIPVEPKHKPGDDPELREDGA